MIKYFDNNIRNNSGDYSVEVIGRQTSFTKTAKYDTLGDEVRGFIATLKEKKGFAYLLISALSDLNWGPNANSDGWPEQGLSNQGKHFGYKTFEMYGHYYHLHDNKDPLKSFGKVIFSSWNKQMHRVELIVEVDILKDVKTRKAIENGEIIQTSMGAHVSYDICNVCHPNWEEFYKIPESDMVRLSKTKSLDVVYSIGNKYGVDLSYVNKLHPQGGVVGIHSNMMKYCEHMTRNRNRIIGNDQKVYVINLRPKFFDISLVRVNADKSSFVLAKVASERTITTDGDFNNLIKQSGEKVSEMEKHVDGDVISSDVNEIKDYYENIILPKLYKEEPELKKETLNEIGKLPIEKVLSSFIAMGMFPKPKEIQRIMLVGMGKKRLADEYDRTGIHITDADIDERGGCGLEIGRIAKQMQLSGSNVDENILQMLRPMAAQKSYYRPSLVRRIILVKQADGEINSYLPPEQKRRSTLPGILAAIAAFAGLAKVTGSKEMGKILSELGQHKLSVVGAAMGTEAVAELLRQRRGYNSVVGPKTAALSKSVMTLVGIPAASYIYSEHAMDKARRGQYLNLMDKSTIQHPMAVGVGAALLANKSSRNAIMKSLGKLLKVGQLMKTAGLGFEGLDIEDYPIEQQDSVIIGLWNEEDKGLKG